MPTYRMTEYTVVQGSEPLSWKWAVSVGYPEVFKSGHSTSRLEAVFAVQHAIDRALASQSSEPLAQAAFSVEADGPVAIGLLADVLTPFLLPPNARGPAGGPARGPRRVLLTERSQFDG